MRELIEYAWGIFDAASDLRQIHRFVFGSISVIIVVTIVLAVSLISISTNFVINNDDGQRKALVLEWNEAVFMPRAEECIDESNGQDLPEFG